MAKVTKRRDRYVLDYYDNEFKRVRKTCAKGTTLKKAKEKLREIEDQLAKGVYIPDEKNPYILKGSQGMAEKEKAGA